MSQQLLRQLWRLWLRLFRGLLGFLFQQLRVCLQRHLHRLWWQLLQRLPGCLPVRLHQQLQWLLWWVRRILRRHLHRWVQRLFRLFFRLQRLFRWLFRRLLRLLFLRRLQHFLRQCLYWWVYGPVFRHLRGVHRVRRNLHGNLHRDLFEFSNVR